MENTRKRKDQKMRTKIRKGQTKEAEGQEEKQEQRAAIRAGMDYDSYLMSGDEKRNILLLSGILSGVCGYLYFHSLVISAAASLFSIAVLPIYKKTKIDRQKHDLRLQFRDFLYSVSSSVNTGRNLEEALEDAYGPITLMYGEDCHMARELLRMMSVIRETNCSAEPLLKDLARRSHVDEIAEFVDVCMTCRTTGGDINALIHKASDIITQNIELAREKHVLLSQKRLESRLLALMPPVVIFFINMSSSDYLTLMYTTTAGRLIMAGSLLGTAGSFLWSFRMISFD